MRNKADDDLFGQSTKDSQFDFVIGEKPSDDFFGGQNQRDAQFSQSDGNQGSLGQSAWENKRIINLPYTPRNKEEERKQNITIIKIFVVSAIILFSIPFCVITHVVTQDVGSSIPQIKSSNQDNDNEEVKMSPVLEAALLAATKKEMKKQLDAMEAEFLEDGVIDEQEEATLEKNRNLLQKVNTDGLSALRENKDEKADNHRENDSDEVTQIVFSDDDTTRDFVPGTVRRLDPATVKGILEKINEGMAKKCPLEGGMVTVRFMLHPDGTTSDHEVVNNDFQQDDSATKCVLDTLKSAVFPKYQSNMHHPVKYSFKF